MSLSLIIGSRASFLAKIQTFIVKQELKKKLKVLKLQLNIIQPKVIRIKDTHRGKI